MTWMTTLLNDVTRNGATVFDRTGSVTQFFKDVWMVFA